MSATKRYIIFPVESANAIFCDHELEPGEEALAVAVMPWHEHEQREAEIKDLKAAIAGKTFFCVNCEALARERDELRATLNDVVRRHTERE